MVNILSHCSKYSQSVHNLGQALKDLGTVTLHYGNGVNKLDQYNFFKANGIPCPEFTEKYEVAKSWIKAGFEVVARTLVQGHAGHGVIVTNKLEELPPDAKIYTKYQLKLREFRVNIFKDKLVNVREKKLMNGHKPHKVRAQSNGYTTTFAKDVPQQVIDWALKAAQVSESDFKGVDVIYNKALNKAFILEVNSGPSIEGQSVNDYVKAIKTYVESL